MNSVSEIRADTVRRLIHDLVKLANRLDPKQQYLFLRNDMAATDDLKTVSDYVTAQSARITALEANQLTPDDVQAKAGLAALAQQITAAEAPAAPAAPAPAPAA